jgi:hypothetical protein
VCKRISVESAREGERGNNIEDGIKSGEGRQKGRVVQNWWKTALLLFQYSHFRSLFLFACQETPKLPFFLLAFYYSWVS